MKKTILIILTILATISAQAQITIRIEGRIIGENPTERTLLFGEFNQDFRIKPAEEIPVKDGRFSYEWTAKDTTAFTFCFEDEYENGSWSYYTVFSEGKTLHVTLTRGDAEMIVDEESLTRQNYSMHHNLYEIDRKRDRLEEDGKYYTAEFLELANRLHDNTLSEEERDSIFEVVERLAKSDESLAPEGKLWKEERGRLNDIYKAEKDSIIAQSPNILGLYLLAYDIYLAQFRNKITSEMEQTADRYEAVYPEHPLSNYIRTTILASKMKASGGRIPDLRARDLSGNEVSLRSLITSKFTILDLWASWCGPCRRHSIELIPVYEEFHPKGLSVLAVAREYKDTAAMRAAMKKDGYPWPSYVDLGDEFQVWQQMGAGNAGGAIFLLDSEGKVLKTNPTAEEVREYLKENL